MRKKKEEKPEMKAGGATNVTGGTAINIEAEPDKRGRLKRPRLGLPPQRKPQYSASGTERGEEDVGGSTREEAQDEEVTGASEEASLGGPEVPAEGNTIFNINLAQKTSNQKKQKGAKGVEGVGKPRGGQGYGPNRTGKQQWDPGSEEKD